MSNPVGHGGGGGSLDEIASVADTSGEEVVDGHWSEISDTEPSDVEHAQHPKPHKKNTGKSKRERKKRRLLNLKACAKAEYTPSAVAQMTPAQARRRRKKNADLRKQCAQDEVPVPAEACLLPSLPVHLRPVETGGNNAAGSSSSSSRPPPPSVSGSNPPPEDEPLRMRPLRRPQ